MPRIAVLEPTTLLGREVKETLEQHPELAAEIRLLTTHDEEYGTLTETAGAAAVVGFADPDALGELDLIFVCGELTAGRPVLEARPPDTTVVILCPDATLADGRPVVAGVNPAAIERGEVLLSPHPAAVFLAHLLHALADLQPEQAVATVIQPTSVHGESGLDELLEQARRILAMAALREEGLFGAQLAFNVLPGTVAGEGIAGQVRATLDTRWPLAVEVLQGAVFHGMVVSLWVELEGATDPEVVREGLLSSPWIESAEDPEVLGPVASATEGRILLGGVRADSARPGGFWIRAVMDNLTRGGALNAVETATEALG